MIIINTLSWLLMICELFQGHHIHSSLSWTVWYPGNTCIVASHNRWVFMRCAKQLNHYNDVIMDTMTSQITSLSIVYSTVNTGADQRKHQSSASLAFMWGIHRGPVNSPHKRPVTLKIWWRHHVASMQIAQLTWSPSYCYWHLKELFYRESECFSKQWQLTLNSVPCQSNLKVK